jgi:hypothetical protein
VPLTCQSGGKHFNIRLPSKPLAPVTRTFILAAFLVEPRTLPTAGLKDERCSQPRDKGYATPQAVLPSLS